VYGTQLISRSDSDWVIVPITEDPLFVETNRRFPMPKAILAQLHNYKKKGLQFEGIYVGHEIEPGVLKPGQSVTLDLIKPPPAPVVHQRLSSLSSKAQNAWQVLGGIGTDAARIAGWAAMIGLAAPIAVGVGAGVAVGASLPFIAAAITYDPILFGLHIDRSVIVYGRPLAAWYYLTHWDW
jgi:hypothetical protein